MPRLLVDISAHGYGHLSQAAPVLAALHRRRPDIELTVRCALPRAVLARRIAAPFGHIAQASDFGFVMRSAIDIDRIASAERYREFHADWPARVAAEAGALRALGVDLVLANAAYLPLAGADAARIPALGMCSLNWADLFAAFFGGEPWAPPIARQMLAAYNAAACFLRITPGMPMAGFARRRIIGPIASLAAAAEAARGRLAQALDLPPGARCVLVAMGGMELRLPVETWPRHAGLVWLCPAEWKLARDDVRGIDDALLTRLGLAYVDLLAAVDAVFTKPGYGTFAEAACNGVPLLYVPRGDWPEEAPMVAWAVAHNRVAAVPRAGLAGADLLPLLEELWARMPPPRPRPSGAEEAATAVLGLLEAGLGR